MSYQEGAVDAVSAVKISLEYGRKWLVIARWCDAFVCVESPVLSVPLEARLAHIRLGHPPPSLNWEQIVKSALSQFLFGWECWEKFSSIYVEAITSEPVEQKCCC